MEACEARNDDDVDDPDDPGAPATDRVEFSLANDRMEIEDEREAKFRIERLDATLTELLIEIEEASDADERIESPFPIVRVGPVELPEIDILEDSLASVLIDKLDPRVKKSNTDVAEANLENDLTDILEENTIA
jgi:hypothetical protein